MPQKRFFLYLLLIVLLGFCLRLIDYDRVPGWREVDDEIHYAWTGMTWFTRGVPESWSWLESYQTSEQHTAWGVNWRLVSPMLEKPPLYSLLSGATVLFSGAHKLPEVRLSVIRLLPLTLSLSTIAFTGLVAQLLLGSWGGLLCAFLYVITPTFVLSNRVSVTENLLAPLSLGVTYLLIKWHDRMDAKKAVQIGVFAGFAALTKQLGLAVWFATIGIFIAEKKWRLVVFVSSVAIGLFALYPLTGAIYDWKLFTSVAKEQRKVGIAGGLPQLPFTITGRPLVTTEQLFLDGIVLLGYLLFFTSPFWFVKDEKQREKQIAFLAFPFAYLLLLVLTTTGAEAIASGQAFWGWYLYPLFPYLSVLIAAALQNLWQAFSLFKLLAFIFLLGSSTIRFLFLLLPTWPKYRWQSIYIFLTLLVLITGSIKNRAYRRFFLLLLFFVFALVHIMVSIRLIHLYPSALQPN